MASSIIDSLRVVLPSTVQGKVQGQVLVHWFKYGTRTRTSMTMICSVRGSIHSMPLLDARTRAAFLSFAIVRHSFGVGARGDQRIAQVRLTRRPGRGRTDSGWVETKRRQALRCGYHCRCRCRCHCHCHCGNWQSAPGTPTPRRTLDCCRPQEHSRQRGPGCALGDLSGTRSRVPMLPLEGLRWFPRCRCPCPCRCPCHPLPLPLPRRRNGPALGRPCGLLPWI
mmetsp:Transcript_32257/g.75837  ORF Transcript_32257/g.75837 Transcript_32257/m.75837 type:complete len:224 (+) Transcript_32257:19-690(+)